MNKKGYVILVLLYGLSVIYNILWQARYSNSQYIRDIAVTNPDLSDFLIMGAGTLLSTFLFTSIFTVVIQLKEGWNKNAYMNKTIKGMPFVLFLLFLMGFIS